MNEAIGRELMEAFNRLYNLGIYFRESGLTPPLLIALALVFALTLIISLREVLTWYLRINHLQQSLNELKTTVMELQRQLQLNAKVEPRLEPASPAWPTAKPEKESSSFPLHH